MASRFSLLTAFIAITVVALLCALYPTGFVPYIVNIGKLVAFAFVLSHVALKGRQAIFSIGFCAWFIGRFLTREPSGVNLNLASLILSHPSISPRQNWDVLNTMYMYEDILNLLLACVMGWVCMWVFVRKKPSEEASNHIEIVHDDLPPSP